jgi:hypothetical protein
MNDNRMLIVDTLLRQIAEELDIPPSKYRQAIERYTAVGRWLEDGTYPEIGRRPVIYPQGSFRLGTVVRPYCDGAEGDYDIDLACELAYAVGATTAQNIKHLVGDRLKENGTYHSMLDDEGRRCWTLLYAESDGVGFHLDVLPCVPNPIVLPTTPHGGKAVEITDRKEGGSTYAWGKSNPAGYGDWFDGRQRPTFLRLAPVRKALIQRQHPQIFARMDDVPDQLVRTPLQRAIQILKRHRDVRFAGRDDECDKPISIIITTLAALAYQQESDVFSALGGILDKIQRFHETGVIRCENDRWIIENPVNPGENFADRWNDPDSKKPEAFFRWVNWVQEDIDELLNAASAGELSKRLTAAFGDVPGKRVAGGYTGPMPGTYQQPMSLFKRVANRLVRFDASHRQPPRWRMSAARYSVEVKARFCRRGFRPTGFASNSPPLPKGATINFEAVTSVPKPYKVFWQVVNTGDEARLAEQLRGDFYDSHKSGRHRDEFTEYSGMHWVECFVVKDAVCVARSGEFVVNIV